MQNKGVTNLPGLKRSVERSKRNRTRVLSLDNSPVLPRKRTREEEECLSDGDDPFSSPPAKKMASNDALLRALNDRE